MPLYEYECKNKHHIEVLRPFDRRSNSVVCGCGETATLMVSMPAKTAYGWGDTKWDGYYDRGLGVKLRDKSHREQVMQARGLRECQDGEVEAEQRKVMREHEAHEKNIKTYQRVLEDTGSSAMAMKQTFPDAGVRDV